MRSHVIPVKYADAKEIATVVRDVFATQLFDSRSNAGRGNIPNVGSLSRLSGGSRTSGGRADASQGKLTVGVDDKTNSLIVGAPTELFREVENLVQTLDDNARQQGRSTRVLTLRNTSPEAVEKVLGNLLSVRTTEELQAERQERARVRAEEEQDRANERRGNTRRPRQQDIENVIRGFQSGDDGGGFRSRRFGRE